MVLAAKEAVCVPPSPPSVSQFGYRKNNPLVPEKPSALNSAVHPAIATQYCTICAALSGSSDNTSPYSGQFQPPGRQIPLRLVPPRVWFFLQCVKQDCYILQLRITVALNKTLMLHRAQDRPHGDSRKPGHTQPGPGVADARIQRAPAGNWHLGARLQDREGHSGGAAGDCHQPHPPGAPPPA